MKFSLWLVLAFICALCNIAANPFLISFPEKDDLTNDDYVEIQDKLRAVNIRSPLKALYPPFRHYHAFEDFLQRCSQGLKQTLIMPEKGLLPICKLEMIGQGGDMCIVTYAPFDGSASKWISSIPAALANTGFNGYFMYRVGGVPNPTGQEIQYAGVPGCFKLFMMLEAQKLGFDTVLWIDPSALPLNDPTPLFRQLETQDVLFIANAPSLGFWRNILPTTQKLLKKLTNTDVLKTQFISTSAFGLRLSSKTSQRLISDFRQCVELGTPFFSFYPEAFVISAIMGQNDIPSWINAANLKILSHHRGNLSSAQLRQAKFSGVFFILREP